MPAMQGVLLRGACSLESETRREVQVMPPHILRAVSYDLDRRAAQQFHAGHREKADRLWDKAIDLRVLANQIEDTLANSRNSDLTSRRSGVYL
jgi:hypothetical protein